MNRRGFLNTGGVGSAALALTASTQVAGAQRPGTGNSAMIRFYRRFGFRIEILGQARSHWGEKRFPVTLSCNVFL